MATGFDRLERLFSSKRKASSASVTVATSTSPQTGPQFPSPSFIRPTTTRMAAREEVRLRIATGRSPSVPDIIPSRLGSLSSHASSPGFSLSPLRSPSLRGPHSQADSLVAKLREYQFPNSPSREENATPMSTAFNSVTERREIPSPRSQSPLRLHTTPRLDTPPSPDLEETGSCHRSMESIRIPTPSSYNYPPTPEDSPEILPVRNLLADSKIFDIAIDKALFEEIEDQLLQSFDHGSLNDSYSDSSPSEASSSSSTLREPDFNEFLNLSDDDIAELAPENLDLESDSGSQLYSPLTMHTSSPPPEPATPSLLTLTPPPTSRPATAAAFEAARIAKRYDFDLVYVVNLWPGGPREQVFGLESASSCERPLVGRLLAAHGLHQVPSPLQIALNVHTTILRSKGWVEYRNPEAQSHELARGYACSFYTGKYSQGGSVDRDSPVSGVRLSEMIDRGIVFAAYRKPRIGPCRLGHTFTGEELSSLYEDAETLVEMLIDIHARNRQCQPDSYSQLCDETGPMPQQELDQVSS
ncbi:uncharacterized protein TRIVIDRAFT_57429 [Trichoderma virens Gv29-8]|uniref:Uncharacterized protein n=1 Tax=Hypocrea virens (strain Gv29-8 / FGSC 10586) TaxID=413071 RepID=G9N783_HYPVG|nr:uncharacterized protein TRIVIDRAFT_57429 [Trichoderma virens Gv29-8]EHK17581.1 hypothetical protein TRIVIDRAFT_57429 [Trichoderma virens Gv29-8]UKZ53698.1 hypothetical protein TrVGV298_007495 [Trichoderma virens]